MRGVGSQALLWASRQSPAGSPPPEHPLRTRTAQGSQGGPCFQPAAVPLRAAPPGWPQAVLAGDEQSLCPAHTWPRPQRASRMREGSPSWEGGGVPHPSVCPRAKPWPGSPGSGIPTSPTGTASSLSSLGPQGQRQPSPFLHPGYPQSHLQERSSGKPMSDAHKLRPQRPRPPRTRWI